MTDPDAPSTRSAEVKRWIRDIETAQKREKRYREEGKRVMEIYEGEKNEDTPFNILYSNTAILSPALYGNLPRPIVQRRFKDDDALGKATSDASTRMLSFLLDTNSEKYDDFDSVTKETVLDACLPGRGLGEYCYEAETVDVPPPPGSPPDAKPTPQLVSECVYAEHMDWNRYVFGYAKKWQDVPWLAFELYFDKPSATKEFGEELAAKLKYVAEGENDPAKKDSGDPVSERKVARVFKIWDKAGKRLLFVADQQEDYLKEEDDPYKLTGFFPCPKPMRLLPKSGNLLPTSLYLLYENQAKELNRLTLRINKLIDMLKVRGVYDASIQGIADALKSEDGDLTASGEVTTMSREGGLDKHIWLMPIEKLVAVVQQLYLSRQQCKSVIYEITGISDIMRGDTQASETLGAQKLKSQYGSLRLKDMQKEVQRYVRDSLRIMLEMAAQMFSQDTWARATGLPYLTDAAAMAAQIAMQQAAVQAAQAQQAGQPPPPPPPALPPKWSDILALLKDDMSREYKVDIETNSTIDPNASEQRQDMMEMLNALAQFLNGIAPLVMEGALPMDAAKAILLGIVRQYEMGNEVEDYIRQMQQPPPKPPAEDKSAQLALQTQLSQEQLKSAGLTQQQDLQKREYALGLKDADLKVREASLTGREELHRIQTTAAKGSIQNEHKRSMVEHKQVADNAVQTVKTLLKQMEMTLAADAKQRQTEKASAEKVQGVKDKAAEASQSMQGLLKELTVAIKEMSRPKTRKIVKGKDGTKTMVEE